MGWGCVWALGSCSWIKGSERVMKISGLNRVGVFGVLAFSALLAGCGGDSDPQVIEEVTFAASLGVNLAAMDVLPSGVYTGDSTVGAGELVVDGSEIAITYTGWLTDGTQFDSSGFSMTVGVTNLVPGFTAGVLGMRVGGTRLVVIPPAQAYGQNEVGDIPPGSILVFEITVDSMEPSPVS